MKKMIPILFSVILLLCGCGNGAENTTTERPSVTSKTSESSRTSETTRGTTSFTTTELITSSEASVPAAASSEPIGSETPPETALLPEDYENEIVKTAEGLLGIAFADGGTSPAEGFDNSGFIYYVLRKNGYVGCPRQIGEQIEWGETAVFEEIKPGDVVYFSSEAGGRAEFGGIYAGGGIMIYSPYPGETVKTADITTNYWSARFVTALSL